MPKHFVHGDYTKKISPVALGNSISELKLDLHKLNETQNEQNVNLKKNEY